MKLVVVTPYPPGWRGIGEYGRSVVQGVAALGGFDEIVVLAEQVAGTPAAEQDGKAVVRRVWQRGALDTTAVILRNLRRERPEVVWFNVGLAVFGGGASAFLALSAPALTKALGFPTVVTLHELLDVVDVHAIGAPLSPVARIAAGWATRLLLTADTVYVTLDSYRTLLHEKYGRADVQHMPHGSLPPLRPLSSALSPGGGTGVVNGNDSAVPLAPTGGKGLGDRGPASRVVMLANHAPHKGLDLLLAAHAQLLPRIPGLELVMTGGDHPRFPGYVAEMRQRWHDLAGVTWAGYLSEEDLAMVFDSAAVVAIPSRATTGASSVLSRAVAHGRAVVAADLPDLHEMARDRGLAVRFFAANSQMELAAALEAVLTDDALRERMERQNRSAAEAYTATDAAVAYQETFLRHATRRSPLSAKRPSRTKGSPDGFPTAEHGREQVLP